MNQDFSVSNTTTDLTHVGPVAQEIALDKNGSITLDQTLAANAGDAPLTIAAIKQAALGTSVTIRPDPVGANVQDLTLNKAVGDADGSVASALVSQLGLLRIHDGVTVNFACFSTAAFAAISLSTDDANILGGPLVLFAGGAEGLALVSFELTLVGTAATPPVVTMAVINIT